ncbi:kinase-like domain-containing protein [Xylaria sp. FL1777]|nr:kinase-like domain-containing protein [Xylaria sp. FL1777]
MSSYTPITLPYFAPAHTLPAPLPTLEEVLSSTDFLSFQIPNLSKQVSRVGKHFVAKYGAQVRSVEGETMLFIQQHTTIPIPQVYAIYTFGEGKTMIIMEFIEGKTIDRCIMTIDRTSFGIAMERLRAQVDELRRIPAPNYYGSIGRQPLFECYHSCEYGPFDNIKDFITANYDTWFPRKETQRFTDLKKFFTTSLECIATGKEHINPVFTHGDLHEQNVIIRSDGTPFMIDFEESGFYPAYYEHLVTAMANCQFDCLSEKFPDECAIIMDCRTAWHKAEHEELLYASEEEMESQKEQSGI